MLETYILLNRKCRPLVKIFLFNVLILLFFIIYGINTYYYQTSIQLHSKILLKDSLFYLEVLIPEKEVSTIIENKKLKISNQEYYYKVIKIEDNITYKDNINYQKGYLEIKNLERKYQKKGYHLIVQFLKEKKKIIDYLKE